MYSAFSLEIPNLSEVEKKVKACMYTSIHMFALDIRKIWKHYFSIVNNPEIYHKTFDISQCFEEIMIESEDLNAEEHSFEQINRKMKEIEEKMKLEKSKNSQFHQINTLYDKAPLRPSVPIQEKPMTITEKNILGNKIRMLSQDQMKGIINILSEHCPIDNNSKYFEFDIETLSTRKLRDLEKYVKKCLKSSISVPQVKQLPIKEKNDKAEMLVNSLKAGFSSASKEIQNKSSILAVAQSKPAAAVQAPKIKPQILVNDNLDSLSSSESNDSGSLSSLDFKKGR